MNRSLNNREKRLLRRTQISLLVITLILVMVRWSTFYWPFLTWPMYSHDTPDVPEANFSLIELKLFNGEEEIEQLNMFDLLHFDRTRSRGIKISELAFTEQDPKIKTESRNYLVHLVQKSNPTTTITKIEGWRKVWEVHPMANPPYQKAHPSQYFFLDSIIIQE